MSKRRRASVPERPGAPQPAAAAATPRVPPPPKDEQKRELWRFLLLAGALIAVILWRPLSRLEIAYNLGSPLTAMEPWTSYPQLTQAAESFSKRPWVGKTDLPWDPESLFYPWTRAVEAAVDAGTAPLWFPYAACGTPLLGNQQSAVFDPFQIFFYLFHSLYVYDLIAVLRLLLAAFFAYLFARRIGMRREAAFFAGALTLFCSSLYPVWSHPHGRTLALLPALLWAAEAFVQERSPRTLLDVTAIAALSVLFGAPEMSFDTFLATGVYVLVRLYQDRALGWARKAALAAQFGGAAAAASLIAAAHLLPAQEYFRLSYGAAWRGQNGFGWEVLAPYTRPFASGDALPMLGALACAALAWRLAATVRKQWRTATLPVNAVGLALVFAALTAALGLLLRLGMDESFLALFFPRPLPFNRVAFAGLFPVSLALFALLDPERPDALRALAPAWLLNFLLCFRVFGFSHGAAALPIFKLATPEYRMFLLPMLLVFWAAWGLQRLLDASAWEAPVKRREAALLAIAVAMLPAWLFASFQLKPWLVERVDVGLHPSGLLTRGSPQNGGLMGADKQPVLAESYPVRGWFSSRLPIAQVAVGTAPDKLRPATLDARGERTYFSGAGTAPGFAIAVFRTSDGRQVAVRGSQADRYELPALTGTWAVAAASLAALLLCLFFLPGRATLLLVFAFALIESFRYTLYFVPSVPKNAVLPPTPVSDLIRKDHSLFRTFSPDSETYWRPASGSLFGFQDFRSNDAVDVMRYIHFQHLALSYLQSPDPKQRDTGYRLLDLANVKYYYTNDDKTLPAGAFDLLLQAPRLKLWRSKRVLPRALVFDRAEFVPDTGLDDNVKGRETLRMAHDWLESRRDRLADTLLLHDAQDAAAPAPAKPAPARAATIVSYAPGRIEIDVPGGRPGYLFLSDTYYPGWRAFVDGQERPVLKAWLAFRAVRLEAGSKRVVFEYRPRSFAPGAALSLFGCALWVLLYFLALRRRAEDGAFVLAGERVVEWLFLADLAFWLLWLLRHASKAL